MTAHFRSNCEKTEEFFRDFEEKHSHEKKYWENRSWEDRTRGNESEEKVSGDTFEAKPDPFETLGVSRAATKEEIKKAYKEALKLYHPDKNSTLPPKLKESSTEITKAINDAYNEIRGMGLVD